MTKIVMPLFLVLYIVFSLLDGRFRLDYAILFVIAAAVLVAGLRWTKQVIHQRRLARYQRYDG